MPFHSIFLYMDRSVAGFKKDPSVFVVGASHVNVTTPLPVTVSVAVPAMLPDIAVIVVEPAATDVAKPFGPYRVTDGCNSRC